MATKNKKNYRADNTRIIIGNPGDNPKLGAKLLSDGRESLFLDYYFGINKEGKPQRKRESLNLYLWSRPSNPVEKNHNKEVTEEARVIRYNRERKLKENPDGIKVRLNTKINFHEYFEAYLKKYKLADIKVMKQAKNRFTDFLEYDQEYSTFASWLDPKAITTDMMSDFADYLSSRSKGSGALSIFKRFKKVIKQLVKDGYITENPCEGVTIKHDASMLVKDVLSEEEITKLISYHDPRQSQDIRNAFLFCLLTGIRFCDVKELTIHNIDFENKILHFTQTKVKHTSNHSGVAMYLTDDAMSILQTIREEREVGRLFILPSHAMCLKSLRRWVHGAGIDKHITWHCARHTFGSILASESVPIKVISELMGHSSVKMTEIYTRAFDTQKRQAVAKLPKLNINL